MPKFQTPDPIIATIEINAGDVRITASESGETVVNVRARNGADATDARAAEDVRVDFADGKLVMKTVKSWRQYLPTKYGGMVEITIELPAGSDIAVSTGLGTIRTEGAFGACRLKTGAGAVFLDDARSAVLRTGYGDIAADHVRGDLNATTGSGGIRVGAAEGSVEIRNSNGATTIGSASGDLQVTAANGTISIGTARRSVKAKTANGSIRIGSVERGAVELASAAGELAIGVRAGTAAWVDARSSFGAVHNRLTQVQGPQSDDATVQIDAHTAFGDITVSRAVEASDAEVIVL